MAAGKLKHAPKTAEAACIDPRNTPLLDRRLSDQETLRMRMAGPPTRAAMLSYNTAAGQGMELLTTDSHGGCKAVKLGVQELTSEKGGTHIASVKPNNPIAFIQVHTPKARPQTQEQLDEMARQTGRIEAAELRDILRGVKVVPRFVTAKEMNEASRGEVHAEIMAVMMPSVLNYGPAFSQAGIGMTDAYVVQLAHISEILPQVKIGVTAAPHGLGVKEVLLIARDPMEARWMAGPLGQAIEEKGFMEGMKPSIVEAYDRL